MTKRAGVIGYPVRHSISPVFQQAAFDDLGIDARYEHWETPPEQLERQVASLRGPDVLGANVTIPHKQAIVPLLDRIDESAAAVGAVNTVVNEAGRLTGLNTDVIGLRTSLDALGVEIGNGSAVVVGAGGSARAAVYMLLQAGCPEIAVANRTVSRAQELVASLRDRAPARQASLRAMGYDGPALAEALRGCSLVLNCTSIGMQGTGMESEAPVDVDRISPEAFVYDLVYIPAETEFVRQARARRMKAANGLGMLIQQGAAAFRLWTGQAPSVAVMERAARRALGQDVSEQGVRA
jgi:shikimate dehydrogenase